MATPGSRNATSTPNASCSSPTTASRSWATRATCRSRIQAMLNLPVGGTTGAASRAAPPHPPWRLAVQRRVLDHLGLTERLGVADAEVAVHEALRVGDRGRRHVLGQLHHVAASGREQVVGLHHLLHQADAVGLRRVDASGGPQQVERGAGPHEPRQDPGGPVLADQAPLGEDRGERSRRGGDAQVGHRREHEPAAGGHAVDRCDDRLRDLEQPGEQARHALGAAATPSRPWWWPGAPRRRGPSRTRGPRRSPRCPPPPGRPRRCSTASRNAASIGWVSALSVSGRSSVMRPTGSSTS